MKSLQNDPGRRAERLAGGPVTHADEFAPLLSKILTARRRYRDFLGEHLKENGQALRQIRLAELPHAALLLSASRGGSSVAMHLLARQAAEAGSKGRLILSLPGEQKPHLVLSALYWPLNRRPSDELLPEDLLASHALESQFSNLKVLEEELAGEVGYPIPQTADLRLHAIRVYGRLLMQWPEMAGIEPCWAVSKIEALVRQSCEKSGTPSVYYDTLPHRSNLLIALHANFAFINPLYYDRVDQRVLAFPHISDQALEMEGPPSPLLVEEPPFILPSPWKIAGSEELERGVLVLKDPADVFRIAFWRHAFKNAKLHLLHLSRAPLASIRSLRTGWRYPHGFFSIPLPGYCPIPGFTDFTSWRGRVSSFCVSAKLSDRLQSGEPIELDTICARQWMDAHRAATASSAADCYFRVGRNEVNGAVGFEALLGAPEAVLSGVCNTLQVPFTPSLAGAAKELSSTPVMAVRGGSEGRTEIQADRHTWDEAREIAGALGYEDA